MHAFQHTGHTQQITVLKSNHIPFIRWIWSTCIDLVQQTTRINHMPHVNPNECHQDIQENVKLFNLEFGFHKPSSKCRKNITKIMDYQNHSPSSSLITHHRKKNKTHSQTMMQKILIVFPFRSSLNNHHFKHRKSMHS